MLRIRPYHWSHDYGNQHQPNSNTLQPKKTQKRRSDTRLANVALDFRYIEIDTGNPPKVFATNSGLRNLFDSLSFTEKTQEQKMT